MPVDMRRYPKDWKEIRAHILERDGYKCKGSIGRHHKYFTRPDGRLQHRQCDRPTEYI